MRLTSYTDFGLRALMRLAGEPDRSFTTDEIAGEFEISRHHLIKVVRGLAEAGYVKTQRGAAGGFRLARPAQDDHPGPGRARPRGRTSRSSNASATTAAPAC